jgi:tripartite-type tricarboxylate transporter receptor subunit TctC
MDDHAGFFVCNGGKIRSGYRAATKLTFFLQFHSKKGVFMLIRRLFAWMVSIGLMILCAGVVSGQNYPNRPIRLVTGGVGGGLDFTSRLIAPRLSERLGQQVIVDNRGGSVIIPAQIVAQASPDGYTLLLYSNTMWLVPFMQDNVPYDTVRDFSPITLMEMSPNILVVNPSLPVKSVKELIDLAKARPGALNYAASGSGSASHLAAELFKAMAGVNIMGISYKSPGPAFISLIGGEVQLMFNSAGSVMPHLKSGQLRPLAVTSAQPSILLPGLPTVAATVPGYEAVITKGIFAPAKTPAAIIKRLNQEIVRILNRAEVKEKFSNAGIEVVGSSPEELSAMIKSETARLGKVIKDVGIRAE